MPSKLDADPLLAALFDLPADVRAASSKGRCKSTITPSGGRVDALGRVHTPDDSVETDTSLLHGESISLTDEEYSDAVAVADDLFPPGMTTNSSFTTCRPSMVTLPARLHSGGYSSREGGKINAAGQPRNAREGSYSMNDDQSCSAKKKKKRRPGAIKSLKKLVGRRGKSSSSVMTASTSFDDAESLLGSPLADLSSYVGDNEQSPDTPKNYLSADRLSNLRSKIGRVRSTIHSLEGDLINTRNELARAHQHLHLATMELADMQRAALEADIGLSQLAVNRVSISPSGSAGKVSPLHFLEVDTSGRFSSRSNSSERLHYFTPTSSVVESEEGSDCFTPRSRASSYESFVSINEKDHVCTPILDETPPRTTSVVDKDKTPLTKNGKPKQSNRRFKFDSEVNAPPALGYSAEPNRESNSIDTPSTAASTQNEEVAVPESKNDASKKSSSEQKRVTFYRQESFIRAHDLAIANESDNSSLVALHETDMSDIVNALYERGYEMAMDESDRWTPELGTGKILSKRAKNGDIEGPIGPWPNAAHGDTVLVWTTKYHRDGHGSEYPVVKARGLIPTSAQAMVELLLDSNRVKSYNKMSLGRVDEHSFAEGVDRLTKCPETGIEGEAKIVLSKSQPPVVRRPVELRLLLHARKLPSADGEGTRYLTIGRSVWETEDGTAIAGDKSATRCEMLLSANLIRDVQTTTAERWCEVTTITHGVSPGIPISIGKRIGLAAAAKYIRDIRAVFEKEM